VTEFGPSTGGHAASATDTQALGDPDLLVANLVPWLTVNNASFSAWNFGSSEPQLIVGDNANSPSPYFGSVVQAALMAAVSGGCGTPTDTPTSTASATQTPTYSASPTASDSPTITPTFSVSSTFSVSPTMTPTFTASATGTVTDTFTVSPTPSPSLTQAFGGDNNLVSKTAPVPNPNPGAIAVLLPGHCAYVKLDVYTESLALVAESEVQAPPQGWSLVPLPNDFLVHAPNGSYFYRVRVGADSKGLVGKLSVFR
jgi:hypothetical protein